MYDHEISKRIKQLLASKRSRYLYGEQLYRECGKSDIYVAPAEACLENAYILMPSIRLIKR